MPLFVVHEHHASRLHWDLRLEHNGVLKSWAVPKQPPLKKGIKRLALAVPDHKKSYATYEGTIPKGQYGAGEVKIWDSGTFETVEKTATKWHVTFSGKKLVGDYTLIRFTKAGDKQWLFFKI
jgi:DNA ligase D-like protein (predicted 3'-phosphoesterase)